MENLVPKRSQRCFRQGNIFIATCILFISLTAIHLQLQTYAQTNVEKPTQSPELTVQPNAPGDLDSTFGDGGKVLTRITPNANTPVALRMQPDGKLYVVGYTLTSNVISNSFIIRYNANGSVDTTFGINGAIVVTFSTDPDDLFRDLVVLPNGKILVAGDRLAGSNTALAVYRYNANGTPDTTFGTNGVTLNSAAANPVGIVLQTDGKFIAVCDVYTGGANLALARYLPNGMLDPTFGTNGTVEAPFGFNFPKEVLIQPDGKFLVFGEAFTGTSFDFLVARFNTNGTLDNSFGAGGIVTTDINNGNDFGRAMALQPDGKFTIVGITASASVLVRYNPNGSLDSTFGTNGIVVATPAGIDSAIAIQQNGKIITAGNRNNAFAISRYNANGTLDTAFGNNGIVTTDMGNGFDYIAETLLQPDGKLVAAGSVAVTPNSTSDIGLVRYQFEATPVAVKPRFDFFGSGRTSFAVFNDTGSNIVWKLQNNGGPGSETISFGFGGANGDLPTPGYFDVDNKADIAVWRGGIAANYFIRPSTAPTSFFGVQWGTSTDFAGNEADYDGDGRDDLTVVRSISGVWNWFYLRSSNNTLGAVQFGRSGSTSEGPDIFLRGADFSGDNRAEIVVLRQTPSGGETYLIGDSNTGALLLSQQWGEFDTDFYIIGDFVGDSKADFAVWRGFDTGANGVWYIKENGGTGQQVFIQWGIPNGDLAVSGDYNGDGKSDIAVYRQSNGTYYWLNSPANNTFGSYTVSGATSSDLPVGLLN